MSVLPPLAPSNLRSIGDLLTPEEQEKLTADLKAMADCRRRAWAASAFMVIS